MDIFAVISSILESTLFWGFIAFVSLSLALSGVLSMTASRICLVIAGFIAVVGLLKSGLIGRIQDKWQIPIIVLCVVVVAGLLFALDNWMVRNKKEIINTADNDITAFDGKILGVSSGPYALNENDLVLLVVAEIHNSGSDGAIKDYLLNVFWDDKHFENLKPLDVGEGINYSEPNGENARIYPRSEMLNEKTLSPITKGGTKRGLLAFRVPDGATYRKEMPKLTLYFSDYSGKQYHTNFEAYETGTQMPLFAGIAPKKLTKEEKQQAEIAAYLQGDVRGLYYGSPFMMGQPIAVEVHWENKGYSPARNPIPFAKIYMRSDAHFSTQQEVIQDFKEDYENRLKNARKDYPWLFPNSSGRFINPKSEIFTEDLAKKFLKDSGMVLYVVSAVRFTDESGTHEAHMCKRLAVIQGSYNESNFILEKITWSDCKEYTTQADIP